MLLYTSSQVCRHPSPSWTSVAAASHYVMKASHISCCFACIMYNYQHFSISFFFWSEWQIVHTHNCFNGPLFGTTRVSWYQKKRSLTHTHPDHQTSFINFLHTWKSVFYHNATHPSDHSHLCSLKCHLVIFPYRPGLTFMQHTVSHTTVVQLSCHNQLNVLIGKQWYQLPEYIPATG